MSGIDLRQLDHTSLLVTIEEKKQEYRHEFRIIFRFFLVEGLALLGIVFLGEISFRAGDAFLAWTTGLATVGLVIFAIIVFPIAFYVFEVTRRIGSLVVLRREIEYSQMLLQLLDKYQAHQQFSYGYYREQLSRVIFQFQRSANRNRRLNYFLQVLIVFLSLIVSGLTSGLTGLIGFTTIPWITAFLSLLVSFCTTVVAIFRFHDRGLNLQRTADDIQFEIGAADMHIFDYKNLTEQELLVQFAERVERLRNDQRKRQLLLEQMSQTKQSQDAH